MGKYYLIDDFRHDIWRILRYFMQFLTAMYRLRNLGPTVTIFGSARPNRNDPYYRQTEEIARQLASDGIAVITGGGPGIMEAANKGAQEVGGKSVGLNIKLPKEAEPNQYSNIKVNFTHFFIRKVMLVRYSSAFIIMPGGFGTLDELFEVLTLVQTKRSKPAPIILVGTEYWHGLRKWIADRLQANGKISPPDIDLFEILDHTSEILKMVRSAFNGK